MCKTPCDDLRCALYSGPVLHEGVCNPSSAKCDVEFMQCKNIDIVRQCCNVSTGPMHIRVLNFRPAVMCEGKAGYFDPPQCSQYF